MSFTLNTLGRAPLGRSPLGYAEAAAPPPPPPGPVRFGWRTTARRLGPSPAFSTARRVSATRRED